MVKRLPGLFLAFQVQEEQHICTVHFIRGLYMMMKTPRQKRLIKDESKYKKLLLTKKSWSII